MSSIPQEFRNVTALTKANVYFDGKVVSHSLLMPDNQKKTLGLIYPGKFHFNTDKAEQMEIVAGQCSVKLDGHTNTKVYSAGESFAVPAKSGFDIEVKQGLCEVHLQLFAVSGKARESSADSNQATGNRSPPCALCPALSFISTWTPFTRPSNSGITRRCAANP